MTQPITQPITHPASHGTSHRSTRATPAVRRRRRLAGAALVLGGMLAFPAPLGLLGGGPLAASGQTAAGASASGRIYVVRPGDTLWGVVARSYPGVDPRPMVQELAGRLGSDQLRVGERLRLP